MRPVKNHAHLIFMFILMIGLLITSSSTYLILLVALLSFGALLTLGPLASASMLFVGLMSSALIRVSPSLFLDELFFTSLGGLAFVIAGSRKTTYMVDNFAQGVILTGWISVLLKMMQLAPSFPEFSEFPGANHSTHDLGDEIIELIAPIAYAYSLYGMAQLIIKWRERDDSDDDYLGK